MKNALLLLGFLLSVVVPVLGQSSPAGSVHKEAATNRPFPTDEPEPQPQPQNIIPYSCTTPISPANNMQVAAKTQARITSGCYYVRIYFHLVHASNGSGGQNPGVIPQVINYLNNTFSPSGIYFQSIGSDNINNDAYSSSFYNSDTDFTSVSKYNTLIGTNVVPNALNIYLLDNDGSFGGGKANGIPGNALVVGGHATYSDGGGRQNIIPSPVVSHELGHCLGLYHTFESRVGGVELANGSNCSTAGDLVCDTPGESTAFLYTENNSCQYPVHYLDSNGQAYTPDLKNIMDYMRPSCLEHFTGGQATRMQTTIDNNSLAFVSQSPTNLSISGPSSFCGTVSYSLVNQPTGPAPVWTSSNSSVATINSTTGQATSVGNGNVTFTATGTASCGNWSVSTNAYVGSTGIGLSGTYTQNGTGVTNSFQFYNTTNVAPGTYIVTLTPSPSNTPISPWVFGDSGSQGAYNMNANRQGVFTLQPYGGVSINVTAADACGGSTSIYFRFFARGSALVASPNPANTELTVLESKESSVANDGARIQLVQPASSEVITNSFTAKLYNAYGVLVKSQVSRDGKVVFNTLDLPAGLYTLRSGSGEDAKSEHIQITH